MIPSLLPKQNSLIGNNGYFYVGLKSFFLKRESPNFKESPKLTQSKLFFLLRDIKAVVCLDSKPKAQSSPL